MIDCQVIKIENQEIPVMPNHEHEWTITTELVASGYGVATKTIQNHKLNHKDELIENKHFYTCSQNMGPGKPPVKLTIWTKRGVVRLGFFIKSERAKKFRDLAEDLIIRQANNTSVLNEYGVENLLQMSLNEIRFHKAMSEAKDNIINELRPAADLGQKILDSDALLSTTTIAKQVGTNAINLHKFLNNNGVIFKQAGTWYPYSKYEEKGYHRIITVPYVHRDGTQGTSERLKWTQAGRAFIFDLWEKVTGKVIAYQPGFCFKEPA
jgi:anti-repressor protein